LEEVLENKTKNWQSKLAELFMMQLSSEQTAAKTLAVNFAHLSFFF